jgi:hypothetical protein
LLYPIGDLKNKLKEKDMLFLYGLAFFVVYILLSLSDDSAPRYHKSPFSEVRNKHLGSLPSLKQVKRIKSRKR